METLVLALQHNESNPSWKRSRHPLVVVFHRLFVPLLVLAYLRLPEPTPGQTAYFMVTIGLYLSSDAYHTWRPNWLIRFFDQTMISWYVIVTPLPFVYHEPWAVTYIIGALVLSAVNKWRGWEPNSTVGALVFFLLGAVSTALVLLVGLSAIGQSLWSAAGLQVGFSIVCFVSKLVIYHLQKLRLVPGYWESPESGHFVLAMGVIVYSLVVSEYPVALNTAA